MARPFFWLHIRKAGGTTINSLLGEHYVRTKRAKSLPFIALPKEEWNDNLNNHRVYLGEYEYKRTLFAKKFLYTSDEFEEMFKFAVVRNPYSRALSCWKYLTKRWVIGKPGHMIARLSFEHFLSMLPEFWENQKDRHVSTHTAPVWSDVTDESGKLLLDKVYKLEEINEAMIDICKELNIQSIENIPKLNPSKNSEKDYRFSRSSIRLIEQYYKDDIEKFGYSRP